MKKRDIFWNAFLWGCGCMFGAKYAEYCTNRILASWSKKSLSELEQKLDSLIEKYNELKSKDDTIEKEHEDDINELMDEYENTLKETGYDTEV